jgi:hypothetical protein
MGGFLNDVTFCFKMVVFFVVMSPILGDGYQTTRHNIPEDSKNLRSHNILHLDINTKLD